MRRTLFSLSCVLALAAWGCGDDKECKIGDASACDNGQVCEGYTDMSGMHSACFAPTVLQGVIRNAATGAAVVGARVVGIDGDSHAAVGPVSISDVGGHYKVRVVVPREASSQKQFTLRVSAAGFVEFPSGIRVALPITVTFSDPKGVAVVDGPQDVDLEPIAAPPAGAISGHVGGGQAAGVLVVAEAGGMGWSTVSDGGGDYVIYNVPDGTYSVRGFFAGTNYAPIDGVAVAGARKDGVNLTATGPATGVLTGSLSYVAGADSSVITAVVMRLQSTREVPPGLSAASGNGNYMLGGVPDGTYEVVAAFPTDGLVKDPDPGIAGTGTPVVMVAGAQVDAGQFKVTDPVEMQHPDAYEKISGTPTFTWNAYPSTAQYKVEVFDSQGNPIWMMDGLTTTSLTYAGPALGAGHFYQWRITAFRSNNLGFIPTSISEDLRGVWQQM